MKPNRTCKRKWQSKDSKKVLTLCFISLVTFFIFTVFIEIWESLSSFLFFRFEFFSSNRKEQQQQQCETLTLHDEWKLNAWKLYTHTHIEMGRAFKLNKCKHDRQKALIRAFSCVLFFQQKKNVYDVTT